MLKSSDFELEMDIEKLKIHKSPSIQYPIRSDENLEKKMSL
jgi:hypothetical protein